MNYLELAPLFEKGRFVEIIERLFNCYQPEETCYHKKELMVSMAQFWNNRKEEIKKNEFLWKDWDEFVCQFYLPFYLEGAIILKACGYFIMQKISQRFSQNSLTPKDKNPFDKKLAFLRSLIWFNQIPQAHSFCSQLIQHYPNKSEPWALMGKILFLLKNYSQSLLCYRESFFINPSVLNLMDIDSDITQEILKYCENHYLREEKQPACGQILQWMGIVGVAEGFFNSRRELSLKERQDLEKRIEVYENKYRIYKKREDWLNLIRLYVFQIDYFLVQNQKEPIQKSLKRLEQLEPIILKKIKKARG